MVETLLRCLEEKQTQGFADAPNTENPTREENRMKAVIQNEYGSPDLLKLEEVETPVPAEGEVLVKIHAVSLNGSDWEGLVGDPFYARMNGLRRPRVKVLGGDIAGRVEAVGKNANLFQPGDEVFGETTSYHNGFAEYASVPEKGLARKPAGLTFDQAAAIPQAGVIALQGIRDKGQIRPGQRVLILGAGGSAGTFAVQLAKLYGAEVTGVDNTGKMDFLRSLGADHVIDYTREDFTRSGKKYDFILDIVGKRSIFAVQRALAPGGRYFIVGGPVRRLLQILILGPWIRRVTGKDLRILGVQPNRKDLETITELCVTGQVVPIINRRYPLSEVPEALRSVGEGRARGKVVITVD